MVDGNEKIENDGAEDGVEDDGRRRDEERGSEHAEVYAELHQAGADAETFLQVNAENTDAPEAGTVAIEGEQPVAEQQAAEQRRPGRMNAGDREEARLHVRQERGEADG